MRRLLVDSSAWNVSTLSTLDFGPQHLAILHVHCSPSICACASIVSVEARGTVASAACL
jgi:hypothetical protein